MLQVADGSARRWALLAPEVPWTSSQSARAVATSLACCANPQGDDDGRSPTIRHAGASMQPSGTDHHRRRVVNRPPTVRTPSARVSKAEYEHAVLGLAGVARRSGHGRRSGPTRRRVAAARRSCAARAEAWSPDAAEGCLTRISSSRGAQRYEDDLEESRQLGRRNAQRIARSREVTRIRDQEDRRGMEEMTQGLRLAGWRRTSQRAERAGPTEGRGRLSRAL